MWPTLGLRTAEEQNNTWACLDLSSIARGRCSQPYSQVGSSDAASGYQYCIPTCNYCEKVHCHGGTARRAVSADMLLNVASPDPQRGLYCRVYSPQIPATPPAALQHELLDPPLLLDTCEVHTTHSWATWVVHGRSRCIKCD